MAIWVPWLVDAARVAVAGTGKQVLVSPGWQTRGQGGLRVLEAVVGHNTGTPASAPGDYPSLGVVRDGRAGLVGLLSQLGLGRSGNVYVIGAGLAYHAGASIYAGYVDLNDEAIGIEAESPGDGSWTADQLFIYPRLVNACLAYMRRDTSRYASHRTVAVPAGRKVDPVGISDQWMRQQAAQQGGSDMAWNDAQIAQLFAQIGDLQLRMASVHAGRFLPWFDGAPGGDLGWFQEQSDTALAPVKVALATIIANQGDDVSDADVLAALDAKMEIVRAELVEQQRLQLEQFRTATQAMLAAELQKIKDALEQDDLTQARATVNALYDRLRPVA